MLLLLLAAALIIDLRIGASRPAQAAAIGATIVASPGPLSGAIAAAVSAVATRSPVTPSPVTTTKPRTTTPITTATTATIAKPLTPAIELIRQTDIVAANGQFEVIARIKNADPAMDEATVTIHQRIQSKTRLEQTFAGTNLGGSESFDVRRLNDPGATVDASGAITISVTSQIGDPCVITIGRCVLLGDPGVYPVEVAVRSRATARVWSRFITHLVYVPLTTRRALDVALIVPFHRDVSKRPSGQLGTLASPLVTLVDRMVAHPGVAMTLSATPETLDELDRPATVAGSDPDLVARLRTALAGREVVTGPYVHFASRHLADTRLRSELRTARTTGDQVTQRVLATEPITHTLVADDQSIPPSAALEALGVARIVAPATLIDRAAAIVDDAPITFDRGSVDGRAVEGVPLFVTESVAERAMAKVVRPGDALLAAQHVLTALDFHRLATRGPDRPGAVVIRLAPAMITSESLDRLFEGLSDNLLIRPVRLSEAFQVPAATVDGDVVSRTWRTPPALQFDPDATLITTTRRRIEGYASMFSDQLVPAEAGAWSRRLLAGMAADLSDNQVVREVQRQLDGKFARVRIEGHQSFRLTSRRAKIPLRFANGLSIPVTVRLKFRADKLGAPPPVSLELSPGPTNGRYDVKSRSPGRSALTVVLETPRNAIAISQASYTVRSTAASWVGIALTVGALVVLTAWWGRHGLRTRALRHHPTQARARPDERIS